MRPLGMRNRYQRSDRKGRVSDLKIRALEGEQFSMRELKYFRRHTKMTVNQYRKKYGAYQAEMRMKKLNVLKVKGSASGLNRNKAKIRTAGQVKYGK